MMNLVLCCVFNPVVLQLAALCVPQCVVDVSVSNSAQFSFKCTEFFSSASLHRGKVLVGDSALVRLRPGQEAVGPLDLWR